MSEFEERINHLKYIDELIDNLKKNKDVIQNIVIMWDFKDVNSATDVDFNFVGNGNAILGMLVKGQDVVINKRFNNV